MHTPPTTIGFIGLGNMGGPMAANLARTAFEIVGFDADPEAAKAFGDLTRSRVAPDLKTLGTSVDAVVTMLPDGNVVRHVLLEAEGGALADGLSGGMVIDMSSSDPVGTRSLGEALAARNVSLVDAPVSGGVARAEAGTLAIMVGSNDVDCADAAIPVLEAMGDRIFRAGPLGAGHAAKALNNYVAAAAFCATSEALRVGDAFGLAPETLLTIINNSTGRNFNAEIPIKDEVLTERYTSGFKLGLMTKDVSIAADLAMAMERGTVLSGFVREQWVSACNAVGAEQDFTRAHAHWQGSESPDGGA